MRGNNIWSGHWRNIIDTVSLFSIVCNLLSFMSNYNWIKTLWNNSIEIYILFIVLPREQTKVFFCGLAPLWFNFNTPVMVWIQNNICFWFLIPNFSSHKPIQSSFYGLQFHRDPYTVTQVIVQKPGKWFWWIRKQFQPHSLSPPPKKNKNI